MPRFFDTPTDDDGHPILAFNRPRPIVGAAQRLNLSKFGEKIDKRAPQEWQIAAWRFFENIGEIHYAFNLIGQVVSRVRLFPAVVAAANEVPAHVDTWLESLGDKGNTDTLPWRRRQSQGADGGSDGEHAGPHLRDDADDGDELRGARRGVPGAGRRAPRVARPVLGGTRRRKPTSGGSAAHGPGGPGRQDQGPILPGDAWVARMWRTHPRWGDEPDSSMLGVLDQCEQFVLLDQAMRNMATACDERRRRVHPPRHHRLLRRP